MKKIDISYNPWLVRTDLLVNGEQPKPGTEYSELLVRNRSSRFSDWFGKFLVAFYEKYRDGDVVLNFQSTSTMVEDFRCIVQQFNQQKRLSFRIGKVVASDLASNPLDKLRKLYEEGKKGPFSGLFNSEKMKAAFQRATSPEFEVNVIATMSSGKSTLINALLGKELMPSKNEACTATVAKIEDCDKMKGKPFVAIRYGEDGKPIENRPVEINREMMRTWNDDEKTFLIEIKGDIPTVDETRDSKFVFVDTPGPNNSRNKDHEETTLDTIHAKPLSMVLYVLNATQLGVNDDQWLLNQVRDAMSEGGRSARDRFIFVANKIDELDPEEESVGDVVEHTREYLRMNGIENPLVIPVSARLAKLLRLKKYSPSDMTEKKESQLQGDVKTFLSSPDMNMVKYCKNYLNDDVLRRIEKRIEDAKSDEDLALVYSGIPVLEELLNDFLNRHAIPAKMKDAVDSFAQVLRECDEAKNITDLLGKKKAELEKLSKVMDESLKSKDRLSEGKKFVKELDAVEYKLSERAEKKILDIKTDSEALVSGLQDKLRSEKISVNEATRLCESARRQCSEFSAEIEVVLREALKRECVSQVEALRERYQDYITNVLQEELPDNPELRKLQLSVLSLPSTSEMVEENEFWGDVWNPQHHTERCGFLWLKKRWVGDYEKKQFVNLTPIRDTVCSELRDYTNSSIRTFKRNAAAYLESAKESLLDTMQSMNARVENISAQIRSYSRDTESAKKMKAELEEKVAWSECFMGKLKKVLSI